MVSAPCGAGIAAVALIDLVRYAALASPVAFVTVLIVEALFVAAAAAAVFGRLPALFAPVAVFAFVLFFTTNNFETTLFNFPFVLQAALSLAGAVGGTALSVKERALPRIKPLVAVTGAIALAVAALGGVWGGMTAAAKGRETVAHEIWGVPRFIDGTPCEQGGTLETLEYDTKAYATDGRAVKKRAVVYLPYGYDEEKNYNILYLLHGTGDDENYWLKKFGYNKVMIDNLIYLGEIEPLIVVTPTFYVESDCAGNLDPLTYSFGDELKNDLMPAVESKFSTFAETADEAGFAASRTHRAFAGLSRGAVTTLHSVMCGSLKYFSSFGTFSASRTSKEYFLEKNGSGEEKELPVDCWYVASGAFDFGFESQWSDWRSITSADDRFEKGKNTTFDLFPMRYHSMGNWHLALYNFLQKIF